MGEVDASGKAYSHARSLLSELAKESPLPEDAHRLARFLVTCADPQQWDPDRSVELAGRARTASPQNAAYCNTLAVAHYRASELESCIGLLRETIKLRGEGHGRDWLFLAMALWTAGDSDEAVASYQTGVKWIQQHLPDDAELERMRSEAASLLGE